MIKTITFRAEIFIGLMFMLFINAQSAFANQIRTVAAGEPAIEGRWDLTILISGKEMPSWLEVRHSGLHTLVGYFVGAGGSVRPISQVHFKDGKISFSFPPQWEAGDKDISVEGTLSIH